MFGSLVSTLTRVCAAVGGRRSIVSNYGSNFVMWELISRLWQAMAQHTVDVPTKTATFAQGCFWAPDSIYGATLGVIRTCVGYSGGTKAHPTYHSLGDHTEAIKVDFDPTKVSYQQLLEIFWKTHAPTQRTSVQYTSIIFYHDEEQKKQAEESLQQEQAKSTIPFVTTIRPAGAFHDAEDYHQKYRLQNHPDLLKAIGLKKNDSQLKTSFIAARLNGYVVGRGGLKQFDEESKTLGLDEKTIEYVRKFVIRHQHDGLHC